MKYTIAEKIIDVDLEDKKIVLDTKSGIYFELNHTSAEIYNLLKDGPKTRDEILQCLVNKYPTFEKNIKNDISEFLETQSIFSLAE